MLLLMLLANRSYRDVSNALAKWPYTSLKAVSKAARLPAGAVPLEYSAATVEEAAASRDTKSVQATVAAENIVLAVWTRAA